MRKPDPAEAAIESAGLVSEDVPLRVCILATIHVRGNYSKAIS